MDNKSVACTVNECRHNCNESHFCTLNQIQVKKNKAEAECPECTDCASFVKK